MPGTSDFYVAITTCSQKKVFLQGYTQDIPWELHEGKLSFTWSGRRYITFIYYMNFIYRLSNSLLASTNRSIFTNPEDEVERAIQYIALYYAIHRYFRLLD